jgi:hypothetical protein
MDEEWCILRLPISKDAVVARLIPHVTGDWEILARGFKTNQEALFYLPLYSEE